MSEVFAWGLKPPGTSSTCGQTRSGGVSVGVGFEMYSGSVGAVDVDCDGWRVVFNCKRLPVVAEGGGRSWEAWGGGEEGMKGV